MYQTVVDDVINGVREAFLDEGMDEQVLLELKQVELVSFFDLGSILWRYILFLHVVE